MPSRRLDAAVTGGLLTRLGAGGINRASLAAKLRTVAIMFKMVSRNFGFLLWSLMVAVFVLVVAEVGAQIYYVAYKPRTALIVDTELFHYHPSVVHTIRPGAEVRSGQRNAVLYGYFGDQPDCAKDGLVFKVNTHGFRTPEFSSFGPKAEDEIRVIIVGGSASISWNVGEACTLDVQLKEQLEQSYPNKKFTIINIGSGAWKSFQELNSVQRYGLRLEPDLIIAFNGFNDMSHAHSMDALQAYAEGHNTTAFRDYYNKFHRPVRYLINALALPRFVRDMSRGIGSSQAQAMTSHEIPATRNDADAPLRAEKAEMGRLFTRVKSYPIDLEELRKRRDFSPYAEHVMDVYTKNLGMMARSAEVIGAKLLVFMQPNLYLRRTPTKDEFNNFWRNYARGANFVSYTHLVSYERLKEMSKKITNLYVEDGNKFTQSAPEHIFGDYCHMNSYGYSLMAKGITETVSRYSLLNDRIAGGNTGDAAGESGM